MPRSRSGITLVWATLLLLGGETSAFSSHILSGPAAKPPSLARTSMSSTPARRMPPFKAVLFDLDGTLTDSYNLAFTATNTVLRNNGHRETTPEEYHAGTRYTTPVRLARHCGLEPPSSPDPACDFSRVGTKLGKEFDELYIGLTDTNTAPLYPGIRDLLSDVASSCKVGALSNAAVAYVKRVLAVHSLAPLFAVEHGADDVPAAKPSGAGLLQCCRELGVAPGDAVYVGDSPSDGIAARDAGMPCIGVTWGSHTLEMISPEFDQVVFSVQELRAVLLGAGR